MFGTDEGWAVGGVKWGRFARVRVFSKKLLRCGGGDAGARAEGRAVRSEAEGGGTGRGWGEGAGAGETLTPTVCQWAR